MMTNRRLTFPLFPFAALGAAAWAANFFLRERRRINFSGKTVLIAGASRGLGLELARGFVREGAKVVLLAREREQLRNVANEFALYGDSVSVLECDVRKQDEVRKTVAAVYEQFGNVDVLINNAGIIQVGPVEHMKLEDFIDAMEVHFWGPLYLMLEIVPQMKRRGEGRIVNIASIAGKVAIPHMLPYVASKFALVGLSEGLRTELVKDGIYVTTVCPGLMRTGSHLNALFKGDHEKEFAIFSIANASPLLSTSSERAARRVIEACRYGKAEIFITPQAAVLHLMNSVFPGLIAESLSLVDRALPGARGAAGDVLKRGWESRSRLAPSLLTRPADRAASRNKEHPRLVSGS
ncbi:MAG TPA: SDR family oxidoreductase [Candidatus Binatia bacterium]|jgi:short-subunit dehydrogenase